MTVMVPPPTPPPSRNELLRRIEKALAEGRNRHDSVWRTWERQHAQQRERLLEQQRERKQQPRREEVHPRVGWGLAALAVGVLAGMALARSHESWSLLFAVLCLGLAVVGLLGFARGTAARDEVPVGAESLRAPEDSWRAWVDALCDRLLAGLRSGPAVLREVVRQPERTVEGLRKSCHELVRRERELRALSSLGDASRLEEERAWLVARVESARDAVVKERLEGALRLLDEQRRQRAELGTAASRLEAELVHLYYTLENLYTQVLRVRSADVASMDVAALRRSVERLVLELDAVAKTLASTR
jgi:hypothetical protein